MWWWIWVAGSDRNIREILIYYLVERSEMDSVELVQTILKYLPEEGEKLIMTPAEQFRKRGFDEGIQQGQQVKAIEIATRLLKAGVDSTVVAGCTGLSLAQIIQLKKDLA
jgi:predicted transposase/invertase (TIGR01784 family)